MEKVDIESFYNMFNKLIKENKIKFDFYNSILKLELLQVCYNKDNESIELKFRDIMREHIDELRELNESIVKQRKD